MSRDYRGRPQTFVPIPRRCLGSWVDEYHSTKRAGEREGGSVHGTDAAPFFVGVAPTAYWADREVGAKVLSPGLDGDALRAWLSENLGFDGAPFSVETISGG